ncbi:Os01g0345900 [Oryza sativa Japonica Group]|nr:hypothetical protein OsJ_01662 [Oryza sativa Japonica Group]BAS71999.1 Os01g0345900 [Oryza sativa Japonica Group]
MDTMRKRVQAFTEGVVLMVCPVLLAVSLKKADLKSNGNGSLVGGGISPLAAITLEAGLLAVLFLGINDSLPASHGLLLRASKLLVHLCALLLMALAFVILLLIDMDRHMYCLAGLVLAPLVPLTLFRCYRGARDGGDDHAAGGGDAAATLEDSVNFSAAVTTLLFLGLEGLALEGQSSAACRGMERLFTASLGVTYLTCVLGVFVMLVGTVPDPAMASTDDQGDRSAKVCYFAELLNATLSVAFAVVVVLITAAPLREQAWLVFVPLILSFVTWMYRAIVGDGVGEIKPAASLELTKVTFTGFLAVAVPTFSNTPVGISTRGFVALSAAAVMSDLGWRLLMTGRMDRNDQRRASPAMVSVANVASLCAHLCVAAAVLPFATLAVNAVSSSEPGSGCH